MTDLPRFLAGLLVCAGVTYLIRALPLVLVKHRIRNRFLCSFLYYVPYTVLGVMTVPAVFGATSSVVSAVVGFAVACLLSYWEKGLLTVAAAACIAVFCTELLLPLLPVTV